MKAKRIICILLLLCIAFTGCQKKQEETVPGTVTGTVSEDPKFDTAVTSLTLADFANAGIFLGDSCDVTFGNGLTLTDVPFHDGYYVRTGEPIICAYPGNPNVSITNNNTGIWKEAGFQDGETVTVTLNENGKYSALQEALGQVYSFDRNEYTTDEEFCNFRALSGGNLKPDFVFRGASPVDGSRGRAPYTDKLLEAHGIGYVIDLADSPEDIEKYKSSSDFNSPYTSGLLKEGKVALLDMSSAYGTDAYRLKIVEGLRAYLAEDECPLYIHCMEGKDRTGFVCMLLEALAGASYEEMRSDYMTTYRNYYKITKDETPEKYEAVASLYFDVFMEDLHGLKDKPVLRATRYSQDAEAYLKGAGMTDDEIQLLVDRITTSE